MARHAKRLAHNGAIIAAIVGLATAPALSARDESPAVVNLTEAPLPGDPADCDPGIEFVLPTTGAAFTLPPDHNAVIENACAKLAPIAPVRPPAPSLFRMVALPVGLSASMRKWEAAQQGSVADEPGPWNELLDQAAMLPPGDPLDRVNRWVNWHVRYKFDTQGDEWATATETLSRGFGDCEDFAVAKMSLLLALGIPSDDMYLVLLRDQRQTDHAVLAVNRDGSLFVLDNRTDVVLPADQVRDYTPVLSYSGPFAWVYGTPAG